MTLSSLPLTHISAAPPPFQNIQSDSTRRRIACSNLLQLNTPFTFDKESTFKRKKDTYSF